MKTLFYRTFQVTKGNDHRGLIQHLNQKIPNLYNLTMSSYSKTEGTTNGKCILDPIDYCITEDLENSSATFTFPNSVIRMIGFSLLSAHADRNTMNMDIIGIPAQSENWEEICHIRKDKEYFRGKANYAECVSNKFMKAIKLIQIGTNNQGSFSFVIRYFDFFGS